MLEMADTGILPVLALTLALKRSPLEICFSPKVLTMRPDTVPFPEPGGPIITARKILWSTISGRLLVQSEFFSSRRAVSFPWTPSLDAQQRPGSDTLFSKKCATRSGRVFCSQRRLSAGLEFYFPAETQGRGGGGGWGEGEKRRRKWKTATSTVAVRANEDPLTHSERNELLSPACWQTSSPMSLFTAYWRCVYCITRLCNWSAEGEKACWQGCGD